MILNIQYFVCSKIVSIYKFLDNGLRLYRLFFIFQKISYPVFCGKLSIENYFGAYLVSNK